MNLRGRPSLNRSPGLYGTAFKSKSLRRRGDVADFTGYKILALKAEEMESVTLIKISISSEPLSISFWVLLTPAHDA